MRKILVTLLFLLFGTSAYADCNIKSGSINILANDFPALRTFVETSKQCKGSADFKVTHSSEHNKIAVPALTANPSEFSARIAANSSIVPLMNQDLRHYLDSGNIEKANKFLGRKYELSGKVVKGLKMGAKLGIPTANLKLHYELYLPKYGVYGISCQLGNKSYEGILNIGITPTVTDKKKIKVEAHIFDFDKNIYGENIEIQLNQFIREEIKFNSTVDLVKQINIDISTVKNK